MNTFVVLLPREVHALGLGARHHEPIEGYRLRARGMTLFAVIVHDRPQAAAQGFEARENVRLLAS